MKQLWRSISYVLICVVVALLFAVWAFSRKPAASTTPVVEKLDTTELQAKADHGDAEAQKNLGAAYSRGQGVRQSYAEAAKWYRLAADQGYPPAQTALGELHEAGQGVARDDTAAAKWYRQAADKGYAPAQYNLAVLYLMGKGVARDVNEALQLYRKAAAQGDVLAQYNLGMRYYEGNGVKADPVEAYKWFSLAAAGGQPDAAKVKAELKSKMTRQQVAEANERVSAFSKRQ
jgi:TPR repeat protein